MTKLKLRRLELKARKITDAIGFLKQDKNDLLEQIQNATEELKEIYRVIKTDEVSGKWYRSVYNEHDRNTTDWQALAMTFKPTKRKIKKFTASEPIETLKTYMV